MSDRPDKIEVLHQPRKFWFEMVVLFGSLAGTIGIGVVLDSSALQWTGVIVWFLLMVNISGGFGKGRYKSPQEAADYLYQKYGVWCRRPVEGERGDHS